MGCIKKKRNRKQKHCEGYEGFGAWEMIYIIGFCVFGVIAGAAIAIYEAGRNMGD